MRIISGLLKGRKLFVKPHTSLKPTEGIVKEALISIIRDSLPNASFLDLFAGSGAVGMEAYSNGAKDVFFVEKDRRLAENLEMLIREWGVLAQVLLGDYRRSLDFFIKKKITFDMVFIDPPYHTLSYSKIVDEMNCSKLLNDKSWIIIERHYRSSSITKEEALGHGLSLYRQRKYGSIYLDVYRYRSDF